MYISDYREIKGDKLLFIDTNSNLINADLRKVKTSGVPQYGLISKSAY